MPRHRGLALLLALAGPLAGIAPLAAPIFAAEAAQSVAAQSPANQGSEQLRVLPPKGWKVGFHEQQGTVDVTEVVPPDQTVQEWRDMLVVEMITPRPDKDVQTLLADRFQTVRGDCASAGAGAVELGKENGYEIGLRAIACPRSQKWNQGEVSLFKVLIGNDRTYVVTRSWRSAPFDKQHVTLPADKMQEWLTFMAGIVLCDPRDPAHPCPAIR